MAQWLDPKAPMLARFLQSSGYTTGHFGKWHMGGQRDVKDAPTITEYGFDQSLTNFEGIGPKLLPLTLKPGQDPKKPGRIWHHAEHLGKGYQWIQRSEITGGLSMPPCPSSIRLRNTESLFTSTLAGRCPQPPTGHRWINGEMEKNELLPCRLGGDGPAAW